MRASRKQTPIKANAEILVIGYGNDLRGDDGAGRQVAGYVDSWQMPGVKVVSAHQLTPDLCEEVAHADTVIFADARPARPGDAADCSQVAEDAKSPSSIHASDPAAILQIAGELYGHRPPAWLVGIPAVDFEVGAPLSETTVAGVWQATDLIRDLISRR